MYSCRAMLTQSNTTLWSIRKFITAMKQTKLIKGVKMEFRPADPDPAAHFKALADRTGLGLRALVALCGVHTVARWWPDGAEASGLPRSTLPPDATFDASYFRFP